MSESQNSKRNPSKSSRPARIVVVDDHPMVREHLAEMIGREDDLTICGEAESRQQALTVIEKTTPDLAIVDLSLRDSSGLELIKDLHSCCPEVAVLVVSMHDEKLYAERALRAGARGYITKQEATRNVMVAIRKVLNGETYLSERILQKRLQQSLSPEPMAPSPVAQLTDREMEILELIGRGLGVRQIAETVHLDAKTIEAYRGRLKEKLKLQDSHDLLQYAIRWVHTK